MCKHRGDEVVLMLPHDPGGFLSGNILFGFHESGGWVIIGVVRN